MKNIKSSTTNTAKKFCSKDLSKLQMAKYKERMSICMDCKNAVGNCSWSKKFIPVKGWKAVPSSYTDNGHQVRSYYITRCPLYKPDLPNKYGYEVNIATVAMLCNTHPRNIHRWSIEQINKKLNNVYSNIKVVWWRDPTEETGSFYIQQKS